MLISISSGTINLGDTMKLYGNEANDVILKELGNRIKDKRINLLITQKELAQESNVSLRMISNVENGSNISLDNLISILRVLGIAGNLELLIPDNKINPYDILELGDSRKRVYPKKTLKQTKWQWEDEK